MITYGSYIKNNERLGSSALNIAIADTLIAILAGIAIFPVVFAFGIEPDNGQALYLLHCSMYFPKFQEDIYLEYYSFIISFSCLTSTYIYVRSCSSLGRTGLRLVEKG